MLVYYSELVLEHKKYDIEETDRKENSDEYFVLVLNRNRTGMETTLGKVRN